MAKGSGTTKSGSKSNPRGLSLVAGGISPAVSEQIEKWQTGLDNTKRSIQELEAQKDELQKENELLFSDMKADEGDREYYEAQIEENDKAIDELDAAIYRARLRVTKAEQEIKKLSNGKR